jgi:hypothetical protein
MASCTRNARFELRRNSSSNWTTINPKLLAGEPGVELDTGQMKVGDGVNYWNSLPYVGTSNAGSTGPLIFTPSQQSGKDLRTLTGYYEDASIKTVRDAYFSGSAGAQQFILVLSTFSPTLAATGLASNSLSWDVSASGFRVTVTNPADFPTEYISSVNSVVQTAGTVSSLGVFTAGSPSSTPAGGVSWNQTFSTDVDAFIRPISSTITGGSASATVTFKYKVGTNPEAIYTVSNTSWTINWTTPTLGISTASLSGKTFLDSYASTTYSLSISGMNSASNYSHAVTVIGGTISSASGGGTFTFTTSIHKDNTSSITRSVSTSTTFTRPIAVTGTSYTAILTATSGVSATFTYPSFWIFTIGAGTPPVAADIVSGTAFTGNVNVLGDQVRTFSTQAVSNPNGTPRVFWFSLRSSLSPPTVFKTGASATLLSDVAVTTGNSVSLAPSSPPAGYSSVSYTLYGITLQPGTTFVSIS